MTRKKKDLVAVSDSGRAGMIYHNAWLYEHEWSTMASRGCTTYARVISKEEAEAEGRRPCKRCGG